MIGDEVPGVEITPSDGQGDDEERRISNGQQANGREGHGGECVSSCPPTPFTGIALIYQVRQ